MFFKSENKKNKTGSLHIEKWHFTYWKVPLLIVYQDILVIV